MAPNNVPVGTDWVKTLGVSSGLQGLYLGLGFYGDGERVRRGETIDPLFVLHCWLRQTERESLSELALCIEVALWCECL